MSRTAIVDFGRDSESMTIKFDLDDQVSTFIKTIAEQKGTEKEKLRGIWMGKEYRHNDTTLMKNTGARDKMNVSVITFMTLSAIVVFGSEPKPMVVSFNKDDPVSTFIGSIADQKGAEKEHLRVIWNKKEHRHNETKTMKESGAVDRMHVQVVSRFLGGCSTSMHSGF